MRAALLASLAVAPVFADPVEPADPSATSQSEVPEYTAAEAADHVGEEARVCGMVASAKYVSNAKGRPTFLNLDQAWPDEVFTVVIWGDLRDAFPEPPEVAWFRDRICVTGRIRTYQDKAQIAVKDPDAIEEAPRTASPG